MTNGSLLLFLLQHQSHHRGQMTVLMRQAGLSVPGIYGPSKEEWARFGMEPQKCNPGRMNESKPFFLLKVKGLSHQVSGSIIKDILKVSSIVVPDTWNWKVLLFFCVK
jgi:hypothetical protein